MNPGKINGCFTCKDALRAVFSRFLFRSLLASAVLAAVCHLLPAPAHAQTELGSEDDLTVLGVSATAADPDVEVKGFTVFGSTQTGYTGAVVGPGNVVVNGILSVSSGAYFVGDTTFTSVGNMYVPGGTADQVLASQGPGAPLKWSPISALGDNLGSHLATATLNMAGWNMVNVSSVNFKSNVFITSAAAANYGGVSVSTHIYTPANVYAGKYYGDGSGLSGVSARNYLSVTLPVTVNDYMEIGNFNLTNGAHNLYVAVTVSDGGFSIAKQYILPLYYNFTAGSWRDALPISNTGPYSGNDFALEVRVSNAIAYLRLRRTSGATAGTALVSIEQVGAAADAFTPTGGSGTSGANTALAVTPLTQTGGNVGIGTNAPGTMLEVAGDVNLSGSMRVLSLGSSQGIKDGGTQDLTLYTSAGAPGPVIIQPADVETARFTVDKKLGVGITAPSYRLHVSSAAGFSGTMVAVSTGGVDVVRVTGAGEVYANKFYGDATNLTGLSGDNLGNHIATTTLNMASFNLVGVSSVNFRSNVYLTSATAAQLGGVYISTNLFVAGISSATGYYGDGSTLTGVSTDTLKIGNSYGGGIVFWVDAKSRHALISATADQSPSIVWAPTTGFTGAQLDGVGAGKANTVMVTTTTGPGAYAARLCANYTVTAGGVYYDDWYLPSSAELQLLYAQRTVVGGFAASRYWSSTEYVSGNTNAWVVSFNLGSVTDQSKTENWYVRCVRGGPVSAFDHLRDAETVRNGAYVTSTQTFSGANTFTQGVTASSYTATGIGVQAAQLRLAVASNVTISSEASPAVGAGIRISTNVYIVGFSSATKYYGDGSGLTNVTAPGDNLGNHTATNRLEMSNMAVDNVSSMTITGTGVTGSAPLFKVAGSTLVVLNNGNVGIGTASPGAKLDILGSNDPVRLNLARSDNAYQLAYLLTPAGSFSASNVAWFMGLSDNSNDIRFWHWNGSASTDVMSIANTGNVGIGTTTPKSVLHLEASEAMIVSFDTDSPMSASRPAWAYGASGPQFRISSTGDYAAGNPANWSDRLAINATGNVGISSAAPSYRLVVSSGAGEAGTVMAVSTGTSNLFWVAGDGAHAVKFFGDGSGLSGLGGTLSGGQAPRLSYWTAGNTLGNSSLSQDSVNSLTAVGSTLTVQGSAFSVGGSTLVVAGGNVGIGTASPTHKLHVAGNAVVTSSLSVSGSGLNGATPVFQVIGGTLTVLANGNVGIGTLAPLEKLHLEAAANSKVGVLFREGGVLRGVIGIEDSNGSYTGLSPTNDNHMVLYTGAGSDILFYTNDTGGTPRMMVNTAGRVAIGTNSPDQKLTVSGNISQTGMLISSGTGNNYFAGNVGIGTASPEVKLDVVGGGLALSNSQSIQFRNAGGSREGVLYMDSSNNVKLNAISGSTLFSIGGVEYARLHNNGNVGISTGNPQARLDVRGAGMLGTDFTQIWRNSNGDIVSSMSATGVLYPSVSTMDNTKVAKAGDTMTGPLTISGSSLTVSYGVSAGSLTVTGGQVLLPDGSLGAPAIAFSAVPGLGITRDTGEASELLFVSGGAARMSVGNQGVMLPDGTAGSPPLRRMDDSSVGLYFPGAGRMGIIAGSAERIRLDNSGNVGIGTLNPLYQLHISSDVYEAGPIMAVSTGTSNLFWVEGDGAHAVNFFGNGSGLSGVIGVLSGGQTPRLPYWTTDNTLGISSLSQDSADSLTALNSSFTVQGSAFSVGGSTLIVAGGSVGIGAVNPAYKLAISGGSLGFAGGAVIDWGTSGIARISAQPGAADANGLDFYTNGVSRVKFSGTGNVGIATGVPTGLFQVGGGSLTVLSSGNVGVGTTSPGAKLEVSGQVKITGGGPASGRVLTSDSAGLAVWTDMSTSGIGDNLGHHMATTTLNMNGNSLVNVASITMNNSLTLSGSSLTVDGVLGVGTPQVRLSDNVEVSSETSTALGAGVRISSNVYIVGFSSAARYYGDGSFLTGIFGDNLGNHQATTTLNMDGKQILNVSSLSVTGVLGIGAPRISLAANAVISSTTLLGGAGIYISTYVYTPGMLIGSSGELQSVGTGLGTTVGNARGAGAVDLQVNRGVNTQAATGIYSVLGGGQDNTAAGSFSVVPGGSQNIAGSQYSAVGGGVGNNAAGDFSTVPGGASNLAAGSYSLAAGRQAHSDADGAFTWADSEGTDVNNAVADRVRFKARGGFLVSGSTNAAMSGTANRGFLVTGNGLVGIAASNPQAALDIVSTGTASSNIYAQIWRDSTGAPVASMTVTGKLYTSVPTGDNLGDHTATANVILGSNWLSGDGGDEGIYVNPAGNVGVGTTGPQGRLHVLSNSTTDPYVFATSHTVTGFGLVVSTTGRVGVGTAAPGYKLDVVGTIHGSVGVSAPNVYANQIGEYTPNNGVVIYSAYNSITPTIRLGNGSDGSGVVANTNTKYFGPTNSTWDLGSAAAPWNNAYIAGVVGIGTAAPGASLHVVSTDTLSTAFKVQTGVISGTEVVISTSGKVGVGLTAPSAKLHVQAYEAGNYTMQVSTSATAGHYSIAVSSTGATNINNLVIENRTSDPAAPVVGQIWLRVD